MTIEVLRLGHRPQRDKRITTHVCLTARALGAARVRIAEEDGAVVASVRDLAKRFGGTFEVQDGTGWRAPVRDWKNAGGAVMHLTMYGESMSSALERLEPGLDVLVVVGAEKVPAELFEEADLNVAVGNQPHSEVAALAIIMDRLRAGTWEGDVFSGGDVEIVPTPGGKRLRPTSGGA